MSVVITLTTPNGVPTTIPNNEFFGALNTECDPVNDRIFIQGAEYILSSVQLAGIGPEFMVKGDLDCTGSPNYPAALQGDVYRAFPAPEGSKVGGAAGRDVVEGDFIICMIANAGGTQGAVGTSWQIGGTEDITSVIPGGLHLLKNTQHLVRGKKYFDTTNNILLIAASNDSFESQGFRKYAMPDHQQVNGANLGIYYTGIGAIAGDLVIWGNQMWRNLTGADGAAVDIMNLDVVNWVVDNTNAVSEWRKISHNTDAANSAAWFTYEAYDNRGNEVRTSGLAIAALGYNPIDRFQWGRTGVYNCKVFGGTLNNCNAVNVADSVNVLFSIVTINDSASYTNCNFDACGSIVLSGNDNFDGGEFFHTSYSSNGLVYGAGASISNGNVNIIGTGSIQMAGAVISQSSLALTNNGSPLERIILDNCLINTGNLTITRGAANSGVHMNFSQCVFTNANTTISSDGGANFIESVFENVVMTITDSIGGAFPFFQPSDYSFMTVKNDTAFSITAKSIQCQGVYVENSTFTINDNGNFGGLYTNLRVVNSSATFNDNVYAGNVSMKNATVRITPIGAMQPNIGNCNVNDSTYYLTTDQVDNSANNFNGCTVVINGAGSSMNGCNVGAGFSILIGVGIIYSYKTALPGFSNFEATVTMKPLLTFTSPPDPITPFAVGDLVTNIVTGLTGTIIAYSWFGIGDATIIMEGATGNWDSMDGITAPSGAASTITGGTTGIYSGGVIQVPHGVPTFPYQIGETITAGLGATAIVVAEKNNILVLKNADGMYTLGDSLTGSLSAGVSAATADATNSSLDLTGLEYCGKIFVDSINANEIVESIIPMVATYIGWGKILQPKTPVKLRMLDNSAATGNVKIASGTTNKNFDGTKHGFIRLYQSGAYQLVTGDSIEAFS